MAKQNGGDNGGQAAVYVGWGTFRNSIIDGMTEGLPNVIDKSIFVGMAGGVQSHMMAGLKFLGLIDEEGHPTEALSQLTAENEADRKVALAEILKSRYAALIAIGLERASMKQLLDTLESSYRVSGDTREKAARFFISAAQYAGVPISRHILEGGISAGRRKAPAKRPSSPEIQAPAVTVAPTTSAPIGSPSVGEQRVVNLVSGGTLTLSASVGFMKLAKADRDFVFGLIDQFDEYEKKTQPVVNNNDNNEEDEDEDPFVTRS